MDKYSKIYKYKGKQFRYNYLRNTVEYIYIIKEDDEELNEHKGDIDILDEVGLRKENWDNIESRKEYLSGWIEELNEEAQILAQAALEEFGGV